MAQRPRLCLRLTVNLLAGIGPPAALAQNEPALPPRTGTIIVSTRGDTHIVLFDGATLTRSARFDVGLGAHEIACSPDGALAVGSAYGSGPKHQTPDRRLFVINLAERAVARVIDLGEDHPRPNDMVFDPDGRHVLCTSEVRKSLIRVDVQDGKVVHEYPYGVRAGHMLAATADRSRAFVPSIPDGIVTVIDLATGKVAGSVPAAFGAEGIACSSDGSRVWVGNNRSNSISVIDGQALAPIDTFEAEGFPFRLRFTPDDSRVVVSFPMAGEVRVYNEKARHIEAVITVGDEPSRGAPTSLALSPDARFVATTCDNLGTVAVLDLNDSTTAAMLDAGPTPDGLAWSRWSPPGG